MPWKREKRGKKWCVIRSDTGEVKKCYTGVGAKRRATDYLKALYANYKK